MSGCVRLGCLFALVAASVAGLGQAVPAAGSSGASAQAAAAQAAQSSAATLKTSANLVVVDVVVTDSHQKPVHGLKASDFKVLESGVPQEVKNFDEHTALTTADATRFPAIAKQPAGIYTNYTPAPANGAVNLVLLDALNTPMLDQAYVKQQLLAYLKATPPGTRIAIFGLTTRLLLLQGFTSDPDTLKAVMEKGVAKASPLLDDQVGTGGVQQSVTDTDEDMGADPTIIANMRQFDAMTQSFQLQLRAKYTLDAMNEIARYLANIPGRKNLIWFSGSFPIDILPDTSGTQADPFAAVASSEDEFRETVNLLARSQVAVYPIDARGMMTTPMMSAATNRNYGGKNGNARMQQDQQKFFSDTAQENSTMLEMADATGGHAFVNTNGLTAAVATAIEDGSNFYTLTYTPTNDKQDGKLRKIKVELSQPGYTLFYRKGYYADDPGKITTNAEVAGAAAPSGGTLQEAMTRGTPTPSEVLMKVGVVRLTPPGQTEAKVADGNQVGAKTKGPYIRYSVNYMIEPADLVYIKMPDRKIHADFDLIIFAYDSEGALVNAQGSAIHIADTLDVLRKKIAQTGLVVFHEEISAPAKGEYFLRIGVHETHADKYGAVEVATSTVRNVLPVSAPAPAK